MSCTCTGRNEKCFLFCGEHMTLHVTSMSYFVIAVRIIQRAFSGVNSFMLPHISNVSCHSYCTHNTTRLLSCEQLWEFFQITRSSACLLQEVGPAWRLFQEVATEDFCRRAQLKTSAGGRNWTLLQEVAIEDSVAEIYCRYQDVTFIK